VIFLIFAVGFFFTLRKLWPLNTTSVLSVIVVKIAAPALAVISISDRFTPELLRSSAFHLLILVLYMILLFLTGKLFSKLLRLSEGKKHVFEIHFTFSNTIFIGLPINQIVFGNEGLPYIFTFFLVSLTMFWSLGAYELSKGSPLQSKEFSLKKIINPAFVAVIIGCILVGADLTIPVALDQSLRYLAALCVPLSLLVIGANLVFFANGIPKIYKDEWLILIAKFIISPLYMFLLLNVFGVGGLAFKVFMLTATMPCHMQTTILAQYYEVEGAYAAKLVSISTLVSLVTIPIFAALLLAANF
jgi:hypothetical protein